MLFPAFFQIKSFAWIPHSVGFNTITVPNMAHLRPVEPSPFMLPNRLKAIDCVMLPFVRGRSDVTFPNTGAS